jgi:hypothetical protein
MESAGRGICSVRHCSHIKEERMSLVCQTPTIAEELALVSRLERLVHGRTGSRIRDLRVEVLDDEVVLTGRAASYYAKQLATHAALGEIAPRVLTNAIDVV